MATVALFPSVLGVRAGIYDFADRLRAVGHDVRILDYLDGRTFETYDEGMEAAKEHDDKVVLGHALKLAKDGVPPGMVVAGFSMGAAMAEHVALQMQARGAILVGGAAPTRWFGDRTWPADCPVQVHHKAEDPFFEPDEAQDALASLRAGGAEVEDFAYDGAGHLFNDQGLTEEYDAAATELMMQRVIDFLEEVD